MLLSNLVNQPAHRFIDDVPPASSDAYLAVAKNLQGYKQTTDAYLMVLARERGLMLITFDRKLKRYCPFESIVQVLPT